MGSTKSVETVLRKKRDHPHIHGEHNYFVHRFWRVMGSPPYTWGALIFSRLSSLTKRITPIYMGSTSKNAKKTEKLVDHPHIHGEHPLRHRESQTHQGSPPYTWGAHQFFKLNAEPFGITPIYMGSTCLNRASASLDWDHPHIHGEHFMTVNRPTRR